MSSDKNSYAIGESVILGCTAIDDIDGAVDCTYTGTVNNEVVGEYEIIYSAEDSSGNIATMPIIYSIYEPTDYLSWDLIEYYDDAEGLTGEALEFALRTIINTGFIGVNYGDARYILDETDADPDIEGNIILVYSQVSISGEWIYPDWTREHVWANSYLGVGSPSNTTINIATDLHNLKPESQSVNSSRGNKYFDYVPTSSTVAYEPPDVVKGDIARILFYMVIMYDQLELVDNGLLIDTDSTYMGILSTLIEWHYLDPVDDFERNRNDVIYSYQNNRNPFIDYEHFVELIFGDHPYYN